MSDDREGGEQVTDDPSDRGGAMRFGITRPALAEFLGHPVTLEDIWDLTPEGARSL